MTKGILAHDTGASQEVQGNFDTHASNLEQWLSDRVAAARVLAGGYQHNEVSDEHQAILADFVNNGEEVKGIIQMLRNAMSENDGLADNSHRRAKAALPY